MPACTKVEKRKEAYERGQVARAEAYQQQEIRAASSYMAGLMKLISCQQSLVNACNRAIARFMKVRDNADVIKAEAQLALEEI